LMICNSQFQRATRFTHFSEAPVCESSALIPEFLITFRNKHGQELISRQQ
jgi:hypothetical protein